MLAASFIVLLVAAGALAFVNLAPEDSSADIISTTFNTIDKGAASQSGNRLKINNRNHWVQLGGKHGDLTGFVFSGAINAPANADLLEAQLQLTSRYDHPASLDLLNLNIYGESSLTPQTFSTQYPVSTRGKTSAFLSYETGERWLSNQQISLEVTSIVQELLDSEVVADRIGFVLQSTGISRNAMRLVYNHQNAQFAPKLLLTFDDGSSVTIVPTIDPTATPLPGPSNVPSNPEDSTAMNRWAPHVNSQTGEIMDKCSDPQTNIVDVHNTYSVIGPDGKRYPTWHPPVVTLSNGVTCSFGHEHGRNPRDSEIFRQAQEYFAYDANQNGTFETAEIDAAGIPFGYVNEQYDTYNHDHGSAVMRHEDHVGHKVEYANGEADLDEDDRFNNSSTGGVVVPYVNPGGNPKWIDKGGRCRYLSKVHQGVSTHDAFTNNLHELVYFADCTGSGQAAGYNAKSSIAELMKFGKFGEFSEVCDGIQVPENRDGFTTVTTSNPNNYPGTRQDGARHIIERSCVEQYFLVPPGQFSLNFYEVWVGGIVLKLPNGNNLMQGANMLFDVEDANRYYHPGKPNSLGYSMDLCYEQLGNRKWRGGVCELATDYGNIQGIKWDNPKSAFKGIHRGMYFMPPELANAGGPEVWYTDPFGGNASTSPFAGSIKQIISSKNINFNNLGQIDPRLSDRFHDDGEDTVHAPN